jgi:hypothetical protein
MSDPQDPMGSDAPARIAGSEVSTRYRLRRRGRASPCLENHGERRGQLQFSYGTIYDRATRAPTMRCKIRPPLEVGGRHRQRGRGESA